MSEPNGLLPVLADRIRREGPISVADYMALALGHPQFGYYMSREPFGRSGDFITAPEISQMFGELIGLWAAQVWLDLSSPGQFALVELGPGRGTLMADMLRSTARVHGFGAAAQIHLVEMSPALRARQKAALPDATPHWHDGIDTLPGNLPLLIIANEFFDALPIHQLLHGPAGWRERAVDLTPDGTLCWGSQPAPQALVASVSPARSAALAASHPAAAPAIVELCPAGAAISHELAGRLVRQSGAALFIDYGYADAAAVGDSFQALAAHRFADPLAEPGHADLTAHVDFAALAEAATSAGAVAYGIGTQGGFLQALGLETRATQLMARADEAGRRAIAEAATRLADVQQMGHLFKVLGLAGSGLKALPALTLYRPG
ncbi:class I SAM-dependent methyltransferase [Radicibacter daui]|uniref:class I SAM-dependent methyltransferase n=1 Tax=Radicibacter daui TaxID=3064829 RepID=UPI004046E5B9